MLLGRDRELALIDSLLGGVEAQTPFVLGVSGEPGSGRSAFADVTRRAAAARGTTVLAARGSVDGVDLAFAGLLTLMRPLDKRLDSLAGDLVNPLRAAMAMRRERVDALDVRLAVLRVLTSAAEEQPVTVVLDDADQLDAATLEALRFAFGQLGVDRIGAIVTARDGTAALDAVATHRVSLGPLGEDVLARIVAADLTCTDEVAHRCAVWADGNPLAALELARSLSDDERTGRAPLPSVPRPTARIVESLQKQLDDLSDAAQRALVVAASDRSGSIDVVGAALRALGEGSDGLDEAEQRGIVVVDDAQVTFRHPILRPLAYRLVAASSRRAAHRALASVLVEPRQAAERAFQLVASCAGPDENVAAALELVGNDALRRGARAEAASIFERSARLSPAPITRCARLRRAALRHLDILDFTQAVRLADEAAADGDLASEHLAIEGTERRDGAEAALARVGTTAPASLRADLLLAAGRPEEARRCLAEPSADADSVLGRVVAAALGGSAAPTERVDDPFADDPLARRAHRRALLVDAANGVAPAATVTVDQLVAASVAAETAGRRDDAISACAQAVALLPDEPSAMADAVRARAEGLEHAVEDPVLDRLTPAERRVAAAVAEGRTNREAADHLFLSVKTVDFHLQSVYRKLEVRSRTELAVRLARGGRG